MNPTIESIKSMKGTKEDIVFLAEKVMGWTIHNGFWSCEADGYVCPIASLDWDPLAKMEDAFQVIEQLDLRGWKIRISSRIDTRTHRWAVVLVDYRNPNKRKQDRKIICSFHNCLKLAIAKVALFTTLESKKRKEEKTEKT